MEDPAQDHIFQCNSILAFELNNQGIIQTMQIVRVRQGPIGPGLAI